MSAWDEHRRGDGRLRAHWRPLRGLLDRYAAPFRAEVGSDPLPLPLPGGELRWAAAGLRQRVSLLAALRHDLRGARSMEAVGVVPEGTPTEALLKSTLDSYTAELVRGPDGEWRVVRDLCDGTDDVASLAAFFDCAARRLLGERLALGSVPTRWFGDKATRQLVAGGPRRWVIVDAWQGGEPVWLPGLGPGARANLDTLLRSQPARFMARMALPNSRAPTPTESGLALWPIVWRMTLQASRAWRASDNGTVKAMGPDGVVHLKRVVDADEVAAADRRLIRAPQVLAE